MASPSWEVPTPRSDMGPVHSRPTLGDPCHSHAHQRRPSTHCDDSASEGCLRRQVMEPDAWLGFRDRELGGGGGVNSQAMRRK